ncbi:amidohydrolase family protein [Pseudomonas sp. SWRI154]|uniref:amidohydrolase family protein n=1 Tax=Pseudomonas sp. SWRI154 TaxID=2745501 RepID=UPI0016490B67|nr:amidohydrolase family protein [Pseudomonas sp. SWRI154]MBC3362297.1 amidohydrolase family protein [Pseudomonas sp. SWRI154]
MVDTCTTPITGVDCHAHVFSRELELAAVRRYTPGYDATLADYLEHLKTHGLSHGVLVQPSFLGTDNGYLLAALRQAPERLRGVVVVEPGISRALLEDMARLGVVGVRLNLMGKALPDFRETAWKAFLEDLAGLGWHVELHAPVNELSALIGQLMPFGVQVVIDHFGRPDARLGLDQPGFAEMLELGTGGQVWMKVSGIYRLAGTDRENLEFARSALALLEQSLGPRRLVWGSDWPHTQYEGNVGFDTVMQQLHALEGSAHLMRALMVETPRHLFRF